MGLFCLLWITLFYLFWRSINAEDTVSGELWAFICGSIVAIVHFYFGRLIDPGGFGFHRWLSGAIDIVSLPVVLPLIISFIIFKAGLFKGTANIVNFSLVWLVPGTIIKAISWSSLNDPLLLVVVPILWAAIAVGVPFFIAIIQDSRSYVIVLAILAILIIPLAAASSYWALYTHRSLLGVLFFLAATAPMLVSVTILYLQSRER